MQITLFRCTLRCNEKLRVYILFRKIVVNLIKHILVLDYTCEINLSLGKISKRIGDLDHAWIYIWTTTNSAGKLCLCVYLSWKMERVHVSVHTSQGVVSGLDFSGILISHLVIDDRGRVLLYDGNILIAYANGPLDVRAKLITRDNKDEYVKMK